MSALELPSLAIVLIFTFATTIFYVLLSIERKTWGLVLAPRRATSQEHDIRFVHQILKHLIPVLPASNGLAVLGGPALLIWQAVRHGWSWPSLAVLGFWALGQGYIFIFGRIASAIRDVARTPSDGPLEAISRGVANLIRQHRNGLIHAAGVVALEIWLFVAPVTTA